MQSVVLQNPPPPIKYRKFRCICLLALTAVIFGILFLQALFTLPVVFVHWNFDQIAQRFLLKMNNIQIWTQFPGDGRNYDAMTVQRTFQFYNITQQRYSILSGVKLSLTNMRIVNKNVTYTSAADTIGNSSLVNVTRLTNYETNNLEHETDYVYQVAPGMSRSMKSIEDFEPSHAFVLMIYQVYVDVINNILINYFTGKIFYDSDFTYTKIRSQFTLKNFEADTQSKLWFDDTYGWSSINTFSNWIKITFWPEKKKNLKKAMTIYFGITEDQMNSLTEEGSYLYNLVSKYNSTIRTKFEAICGQMCTDTDLATIQWASKNITADINKPDVVKSYTALNDSVIFDYEIIDDPTDNQQIPFDLAKKLLEVSISDNTEVNKKTTILNFDNALYQNDHSNSTSEIQTYFQQSNENQATTQINYYNNFKQRLIDYSDSSKPSTNYLVALYTRKGISEAKTMLETFVLNNITSKALNDTYQREDQNLLCENYFNFTDTTLKSIVCDYSSVNTCIDQYVAITNWVAAIIDGPELKHCDSVCLDARDLIVNTINNLSTQHDLIKNWDDLYANLTSTIFYQRVFQLKDDVFIEAYGCLKDLGGCTRKYLAELQFISGNITNITRTGLPENTKEKYPSLNVDSVIGWVENEKYLGNKIPEMYGFLNYHYDFTGQLFGKPQDQIFNSGSCSVENDMTIYLLSSFAKDNRFSDVSHRFSIWASPDQLTQYLNHVFFEWYLGGLFRNINIKDQITGYEDSNLKKIQSEKPLMGGISDIEINIQLNFASPSSVPMQFKNGDEFQKIKEDYSENPYSTSEYESKSYMGNKFQFFNKMNRNLNFLNSGILEMSGVDNCVLNRSQLYTFNNTRQIIDDDRKDAWKQPIAVDGSDYFSNQPQNYNNSVNFYNNDIKMNMKFVINETTEDVQFEMNEFVWDMSNFNSNFDVFKNYYNGTWNITRIHRLPIIITLPYYYGVDKKFLDFLQDISLDLGIGNQQSMVELLQSNEKDGLLKSDMMPKFNVEKFTGFTFNYTQPYQYSTYFLKVGVIESLIENDIAIPFVIMKDDYNLVDRVRVHDFESIQDNMKMKNLVEFFFAIISILLLIFGCALFAIRKRWMKYDRYSKKQIQAKLLMDPRNLHRMNSVSYTSEENFSFTDNMSRGNTFGGTYSYQERNSLVNQKAEGNNPDTNEDKKKNFFDNFWINKKQKTFDIQPGGPLTNTLNINKTKDDSVIDQEKSNLIDQNLEHDKHNRTTIQSEEKKLSHSMKFKSDFT